MELEEKATADSMEYAFKRHHPQNTQDFFPSPQQAYSWKISLEVSVV